MMLRQQSHAYGWQSVPAALCWGKMTPTRIMAMQGRLKAARMNGAAAPLLEGMFAAEKNELLRMSEKRNVEGLSKRMTDEENAGGEM